MVQIEYEFEITKIDLKKIKLLSDLMGDSLHIKEGYSATKRIENTSFSLNLYGTNFPCDACFRYSHFTKLFDDIDEIENVKLQIVIFDNQRYMCVPNGNIKIPIITSAEVTKYQLPLTPSKSHISYLNYIDANHQTTFSTIPRYMVIDQHKNLVINDDHENDKSKGRMILDDRNVIIANSALKHLKNIRFNSVCQMKTLESDLNSEIKSIKFCVFDIKNYNKHTLTNEIFGGAVIDYGFATMVSSTTMTK